MAPEAAARDRARLFHLDPCPEPAPASSSTRNARRHAPGPARPPRRPLLAIQDDGVWSIPKGELAQGEDPLTCAQREFEEELGARVTGDFHPPRPHPQKGGKIVLEWHSKETSTFGQLAATPSRWNGPPNPAGWPRSRRSTGPSGSPSPMRGGSSRLRSSRWWKSCSADQNHIAENVQRVTGAPSRRCRRWSWNCRPRPDQLPAPGMRVRRCRRSPGHCCSGWRRPDTKSRPKRARSTRRSCRDRS